MNKKVFNIATTPIQINKQNKLKIKTFIINLGAVTQLTLGKQGTHLEGYPKGYNILNW